APLTGAGNTHGRLEVLDLRTGETLRTLEGRNWTDATHILGPLVLAHVRAGPDTRDGQCQLMDIQENRLLSTLFETQGGASTWLETWTGLAMSSRTVETAVDGTGRIIREELLTCGQWAYAASLPDKARRTKNMLRPPDTRSSGVRASHGS